MVSNTDDIDNGHNPGDNQKSPLKDDYEDN